MQTIDGKTCDICDDGFFFDSENNCVNTNFCEKGDKKCKCEADRSKQWYQGTTTKEYLDHCCPNQKSS